LIVSAIVLGTMQRELANQWFGRRVHWRGATVYVLIWAFRPRPGREIEFKQAYGPRGSWADLFQKAP
jgi:hypothetical protein